MNKPNLPLIRRWVKALLSGKYKQGREHLRDNDDRFCCLGVLCDVIDKKGWRKNENNGLYLYDNQPNILSIYIREKVGISEDTCNHLMKLNDWRNWGFSAIANYLKRKYKLKEIK